LVTRAQVALLADLLDADPAALASLEHLGPEGVRALPNLAAAPILRDASFARRISGAADTASRRKSWKRIARAISAAVVPATAVD
jgi:hypothetical protein